MLHVTSLKAPICACRPRHCVLKQVVKPPCRPQCTSARPVLYQVTSRQCRQILGLVVHLSGSHLKTHQAPSVLGMVLLHLTLNIWVVLTRDLQIPWSFLFNLLCHQKEMTADAPKETPRKISGIWAPHSWMFPGNNAPKPKYIQSWLPVTPPRDTGSLLCYIGTSLSREQLQLSFPQAKDLGDTWDSLCPSW